ncbi:MAG: hypothetical protein K0R13_1845 [Propionibacteriaceae bacterium]|nr:hypothetical protein [Propionibacteriaceae bacterium]
MSVTGGSHRRVETCGQRSGRCSIARSVLDCSLRSPRIALGSRCLPRTLADEIATIRLARGRWNPSARSLVQAAARNPGRGGSRWEAAYFVVVRRREACQLTPPQHGGARSAGSIARSVLDCSLRSLRIALGSRCLPPSLADEIATTSPGSQPAESVCSLIRSGSGGQSWSRRIALGSHLLRRRSPTRSVSAHSFSTQLAAGAGARYARAIVEARRRASRGLTARDQCSQLTAEPSASPAFARTRRNSRARRSASKEEMLAPSSSKAASQAASNRAARWAVTR